MHAHALRACYSLVTRFVMQRMQPCFASHPVHRWAARYVHASRVHDTCRVPVRISQMQHQHPACVMSACERLLRRCNTLPLHLMQS